MQEVVEEPSAVAAVESNESAVAAVEEPQYVVGNSYGLKKDREYSDQQLAFLEALCAPENEGNIRRAMDIAGYSRATRPHVVLSSLREEVIERTQLMMALNAPKATQRLLSLLDNPTALGAKTLLAATKEILDRAGVTKQEKLEIKGPDTGGAMFILPPKTVGVEQQDD